MATINNSGIDTLEIRTEMLYLVNNWAKLSYNQRAEVILNLLDEVIDVDSTEDTTEITDASTVNMEYEKLAEALDNPELRVFVQMLLALSEVNDMGPYTKTREVYNKSPLQAYDELSEQQQAIIMDFMGVKDVHECIEKSWTGYFLLHNGLVNCNLI